MTTNAVVKFLVNGMALRALEEERSPELSGVHATMDAVKLPFFMFRWVVRLHILGEAQICFMATVLLRNIGACSRNRRRSERCKAYRSGLRALCVLIL